MKKGSTADGMPVESSISKKIRPVRVSVLGDEVRGLGVERLRRGAERLRRLRP